MKKNTFNYRLLTSLVLSAGLLFTACTNDEETKKSSTSASCSAASDTYITGDISGNKTIPANSQITLCGTVHVKSGATLTIGKGTTVKAIQDPFTALLIDRGAKLVAIGDASNPIVFTSALATGSRVPSAWGGIVMHGKSGVNAVAGQEYNTDTEIGTGAYGCGDAGFTCTANKGRADNSGTLQYVRVEFAGNEISSGNEFNGIFLAGVGNGTTIDHVQVHRGSDDGIEIFGGSVDIHNVVLTGNQDDSFDLDEGWRGAAWNVAIAVPSDGDQAIEYDGLGKDKNRATNSVFTNFTMLGSKNKAKEGAISIRKSGGLRLSNSYIAHFWGDNGVIAVDGSSTTNQAANNVKLAFESNVVECLYTNSDFSTKYATNTVDDISCKGKDPSSCTAKQALATSFPDGNTNNVVTNLNCGTAAKIGEPTTLTAAALKPAANITVTTYKNPEAAPNTTDRPVATYIGAFQSSDTWADNWTSFPKN